MSRTDVNIAVSEIFSSIQGEGPDIGKPAVFLRLAGCPVQCPGCDTSYTYTKDPLSRRMLWSEVDTALREIKGQEGLVITGGEPLIHYQSEAFQLFLEAQKDRWRWMGLETSGYIAGEIRLADLQRVIRHFTTVCVSPKITPCLHGKQTDEELERGLPYIIDAVVGRPTKLCFKFVVRDAADVDAVLDCDKRHDFLDHYPTYLMPYGNDRDSILRCLEWLVPVAKLWGFILTPRLQALMWGARRGV